MNRNLEKEKKGDKMKEENGKDGQDERGGRREVKCEKKERENRR